MSSFTLAEAGIIDEARAILGSAEFRTLRRANQSGRAAEVRIGGRTVVYEPSLPQLLSGMTLFEEGAFVLGPRAFSSDEETCRTVLHELFRLRSGQAASGVGGDAIKAQTADAHTFAARAAALLSPG